MALKFTCLVFIASFGGNVLANDIELRAATDEPKSVSMVLDEWEGMLSLAAKKEDRLRLTVQNNEGNCLLVGFGIYNGQPTLLTTVNNVSLYDAANLLTEGGVKIGGSTVSELRAESDGFYYVHVYRNLAKCAEYGWEDVNAFFENLGRE